MSDSALENARRHRDELAARINRAQQELDECRSLLDRVDRFLAEHEVFASGSFFEQPEPTRKSRTAISAYSAAMAKGARNSSKEDVAKAARAEISAVGSPIPRPNLYRALVSAGLTIEGADPETVMNTMLWRTRDDVGVIHLRNVGYWLKERDWPASGYVASESDAVGLVSSEEEGEDADGAP